MHTAPDLYRIHSSVLYMLANIDEKIKDRILIQYYNTTCVIYDLKNAEYRYVLSKFLECAVCVLTLDN